jgi:Ni/Co efflux regulator RcnB
LKFFIHEQAVMGEKQEAEDFDESDDEELVGDEEVDLARLTKDLDIARRRGARSGVPAWRKLELLAEQRRTAELTSDFEDYDIDEPRRARRGASYV